MNLFRSNNPTWLNSRNWHSIGPASRQIHLSKNHFWLHVSRASALVKSHLVGKLMMEVLNLNIGLGQMLHRVLNELLFFLLALFCLMRQLQKYDQELWSVKMMMRDYLRGLIMQVFILLLKIINFLLKQLDIEAPQLQGWRVLSIVCVHVQQICLHLNIDRWDKGQDVSTNILRLPSKSRSHATSITDSRVIIVINRVVSGCIFMKQTHEFDIKVLQQKKNNEKNLYVE